MDVTLKALEAEIAGADEKKELSKLVLAELGEIKNLDAYNENDGGNAAMFVDRYNEIIRYIHALESWFIWDGNRWLPDAVEGIHQLAWQLSNELVADSVNGPGRRDEYKPRRGVDLVRRNKI